jgi:outer membrane receptor protein involved in Fe transport
MPLSDITLTVLATTVTLHPNRNPSDVQVHETLAGFYVKLITMVRIICLFMLGLLHGVTLAGNGKISGRLADKESGVPVAGVVQIVETRNGAAANGEGEYVILNISPGTYTIRCSAVGFHPQVITGLVIVPDNLLILNFMLHSEDVSLPEVVVQVERMAVDAGQPSVTTQFDGSEFLGLPLQSTRDLISLSPGTYKQFVSGVLPFHSRTIVDGIDITDETAAWFAKRLNISPYLLDSGHDLTIARQASFIEPNLNAVDQGTLNIGTSGSDYASAAGTLSYTLREGRGAWGGEASLRVSQLGGLQHLGPNIYGDSRLYSAQRDILASNPPAREIAQLYSWTPDKYRYGGRPDITASFATGGSLSDALGVHLTGVWRSSPGRLPNENTQRLDASVKATWSLSQTMRLSLTGLLEDRGRLLGWKNSSYSETYRYFLEGVPLWNGFHVTGGLKWSHFLSPVTVYEIQVSLVHDNVQRGFCDDNNDGLISLGEHGEFLTWSDTSQVNRYQASKVDTDFKKFFVAQPYGEIASWVFLKSTAFGWKIARPGIYFENSTNRVVTVKGDLSSQLNPHHLIGAGVESRLHTVDREIRASTAGFVNFPNYKTYTEEMWTRHPVELGFYLQDKMEFPGLIVNAGVRLEGNLLDASQIANWYAAPDTVTDAQGGPALAPVRGMPVAWKWFFSPRIAFSHPIGQSAAVHTSFSRSRLPVPYSYLFANYTLASAGLRLVNVDSDPTTALNYDLGIRWAFAPATLLAINAYYRDYSNLYQTQLTVIPGPPLPISYVSTTSRSSDARGIEISLQRDITPLGFGIAFGGRIAYAYSRVNVDSPVPTNKSTYSAALGDSATFGGDLPFADIALWDRSNIEILGGNSTLIAGFNRINRITFAFMVALPWDFRLNGTGMFTGGFWYPEVLKADRILPYAESPWNRRVDIRLEKRFMLTERTHFDLFVDVLNVFNWSNILAYRELPMTGQTAWEVYGDPTGGPDLNRPVTSEGTLIYDIPREAYFGLRFGF